jgi:hypothetical protein
MIVDAGLAVALAHRRGMPDSVTLGFSGLHAAADKQKQ